MHTYDGGFACRSHCVRIAISTKTDDPKDWHEAVSIRSEPPSIHCSSVVEAELVGTNPVLTSPSETSLVILEASQPCGDPSRRSEFKESLDQPILFAFVPLPCWTILYAPKPASGGSYRETASRGIVRRLTIVSGTCEVRSS